jgi:hypothetical protein
VIVVKTVIVVAGDGDAMPKNTADLGKIMDAAKNVGLIEYVLG